MLGGRQRGGFGLVLRHALVEEPDAGVEGEREEREDEEQREDERDRRPPERVITRVITSSPVQLPSPQLTASKRGLARP